MAAFKASARQNSIASRKAGVGSTDSLTITKITSSKSGKTRTSHEAGLDDPDSPLQHSAKRRRVEFDLENNTVTTTNPTTEERKIVRAKTKAKVEQALADHQNGDNEEYNRLKERFSAGNPYDIASTGGGDENEDAIDLRTYLEVLVGLTRQLNRSCDGLIKSILNYTWLDRDQQFVHTYTEFLANLLLTQGPTYTEIVFAMLVDKFLEVRGAGITGSTMVPRPVSRKRLHNAIQYLLRNFPMTTQALRVALFSKFPFADNSRRTHLAYVHHLLRLQAYAKTLRSAIMDLIIDRLLKLDVRMQLDLEDLDDERTAKVVFAVQQARIKHSNEEYSDQDSEEDEDEDERDDEAEHIYTMTSNIEKMDAILDSLFEFYNSRFPDPESKEALHVYKELLDEFEKQILPTYKSRHTQFLLFHFGQKSEPLVDAFCGTCLAIASDSTHPSVVRQAASSYLASFVARGAHVPRHIVQMVFDVVGSQLDQLRRMHETTCLQPDLQKYGRFYSLFQALLYIFCFRWRDLIRSLPDTVDENDPLSYLGQDLEWKDGIKQLFSDSIYSKLNPMKVCAPVIVEEFARLSRQLNFLYVNPLLDKNKSINLAHYSSESYSAYGNGALRESRLHSGRESSYQLDPYFPFDPYQLPSSKRWVDSDYVQWQGLPGMHDEVEDSDQDELGGIDCEDVDGAEDTATDEDDEDE
ncbi:hypothetical protein MKZ38_008999 [Zalerion maritima]|uniref:RNA polymerase I-specific transcription initiation factor RRN3 n=1 Tax=Zalerion maritima TaxID=339359 RepID=A0AAD5RGW7_9PEZI|nr:hypothetical protein MKZ38_008999 [Zalerion maritima]